MPLITLEKTWAVAQSRLLASYGSNLARYQHQLRLIKDALVAAGWAAVSSSTGAVVYAGDLWLTDAQVLFDDAPNAHSWIVLRNAALGAAFEICLEAPATYQTVNVYTCAYGYNSDGAITARPTPVNAALEYPVVNMPLASANGGAVTALYSTDHACTRLFTSNNGGHSHACSVATGLAQYGALLAWEAPRVPATWWRAPRWVHLWARSSSTSSTGLGYYTLGSTRRSGYAMYNGTQGEGAAALEADGVLYVAGVHAIGDNSSPSSGAAWPGHLIGQGVSRAGEYAVSPLFLVADLPSNGEILGQLYDAYACDPHLPSGLRWRDSAGALRLLTVGSVMLGCPAQRVRL